MLDDSSFFLHIKTPLAYSNEISLLTSQEGFKRDVYLKLDNCQPSGSFKIRGLGYMILKVSYFCGLVLIDHKDGL